VRGACAERHFLWFKRSQTQAARPKREADVSRSAPCHFRSSQIDEWRRITAWQLRGPASSRVKNLRGGLLEWIDKVDSSQPKY
jgi:hypothetical protein